jgi:hypothetical protein
LTVLEGRIRIGSDPDPDRIRPSKTVKKYTHGPKKDTKSKYGIYTIQNSWDWVIFKGHYLDMTRFVKSAQIRIRNTENNKQIDKINKTKIVVINKLNNFHFMNIS